MSSSKKKHFTKEEGEIGYIKRQTHLFKLLQLLGCVNDVTSLICDYAKEVNLIMLATRIRGEHDLVSYNIDQNEWTPLDSFPACALAYEYCKSLLWMYKPNIISCFTSFIKDTAQHLEFNINTQSCRFSSMFNHGKPDTFIWQDAITSCIMNNRYLLTLHRPAYGQTLDCIFVIDLENREWKSVIQIPIRNINIYEPILKSLHPQTFHIFLFYTNTFFRYNTISREWHKRCSPISHYSYPPCYAVVIPQNPSSSSLTFEKSGLVFCGGRKKCDDWKDTSDVIIYNDDDDRWTSLPPLLHSRFGASAIFSAEMSSLIVCGGRTFLQDQGNFVRPPLEIYNGTQWKVLSCMPSAWSDLRPIQN